MLLLVIAEECMKHSDISRVRRMRRSSRRASTGHGRLRVRFALDRLSARLWSILFRLAAQRFNTCLFPRLDSSLHTRT